MSKITERIQEAERNDVFISDVLKNESDIRGIYGIFSLKNDEKTCLYIGRAHNIINRFFDYNGHIAGYLRNNGKDNKLISRLINDSRNKKCTIFIDMLEKVEYQGDDYYRDMQRLVYAEYKWIEKYQRQGECLNQLPEGNWIKKEYWVNNYKKND